MKFGQATTDEDDFLKEMKSYWVFSESAINSKFLGLQRPSSENNWGRVRLIIPRFKGTKVEKLYYINEFSLMSQLTYGNGQLDVADCFDDRLVCSQFTSEWL